MCTGRTDALLSSCQRTSCATLEIGGQRAAPTGVVVANDASLQRANLLTHQTKRWGLMDNSPTSSCIQTL